MIIGLLELLLGKDGMKIVSIHIGVFIYTMAVKTHVRYIMWHELVQKYF
jgi:hypothetical protein